MYIKNSFVFHKGKTLGPERQQSILWDIQTNQHVQHPFLMA